MLPPLSAEAVFDLVDVAELDSVWEYGILKEETCTREHELNGSQPYAIAVCCQVIKLNTFKTLCCNTLKIYNNVIYW